jgi:DNA-binding MarR family transcriptional regulator
MSMEEQSNNLLDCCLFFTANSLARVITRMGEEEFSRVGMTPSSAFLLTLAIEQPGILQKELAEKLHLAPSTVSRLVDSLERGGLIEKDGQGRNTLISATAQGRASKPKILEAWKGLYQRYSEILGEEEGQSLTRITREACQKLEG